MEAWKGTQRFRRKACSSGGGLKRGGGPNKSRGEGEAKWGEARVESEIAGKGEAWIRGGLDERY